MRLTQLIFNFIYQLRNLTNCVFYIKLFLRKFAVCKLCVWVVRIGAGWRREKGGDEKQMRNVGWVNGTKNENRILGGERCSHGIVIGK